MIDPKADVTGKGQRSLPASYGKVPSDLSPSSHTSPGTQMSVQRSASSCRHSSEVLETSSSPCQIFGDRKKSQRQAAVLEICRCKVKQMITRKRLDETPSLCFWERAQLVHTRFGRVVH